MNVGSWQVRVSTGPQWSRFGDFPYRAAGRANIRAHDGGLRPGRSPGLGHFRQVRRRAGRGEPWCAIAHLRIWRFRVRLHRTAPGADRWRRPGM